VKGVPSVFSEKTIDGFENCLLLGHLFGVCLLDITDIQFPSVVASSGKC
jgi:hypothetical protein